MSPNKPHIWIYWDRLFTSVPTEPIFRILETNFRNFKSLFISIATASIQKSNAMKKQQNNRFGIRIQKINFGLTKIGTDLSQLNFRNQILRILSILLQYSYSTNQIRGIVLNQDQRIQSPGLVIQVKVAISRELREPNPFLLFYILILQSLPPRFYLYHNLMFYYTIYII